jgi:hypothetical protein
VSGAAPARLPVGPHPARHGSAPAHRRPDRNTIGRLSPDRKRRRPHASTRQRSMAGRAHVEYLVREAASCSTSPSRGAHAMSPASRLQTPEASPSPGPPPASHVHRPRNGRENQGQRPRPQPPGTASGGHFAAHVVIPRHDHPQPEPLRPGRRAIGGGRACSSASAPPSGGRLVIAVSRGVRKDVLETYWCRPTASTHPQRHRPGYTAAASRRDAGEIAALTVRPYAASSTAASPGRRACRRCSPPR